MSIGIDREKTRENPLESYRKAEADLARAVELQPGNADSAEGLGYARWLLGGWFRKTGDLEDSRRAYAAAVRDFERAVELNPGMAATLGDRIRRARELSK
jgi:tetratricopeptide (TPR) repeat protein